MASTPSSVTLLLLRPLRAALWLFVLCRASAEDVLTLTADNFVATVKANPMILVEFYAPWCGHCKRLAPDYEQAANILKGRVPLAKVDATVETALAEQYKVEGYPTFYFFRHGVPEEYSGGRQSEGIVQWVEEQVGPAVKTLASERELKAALLMRGSKVYIVAKGDQALMDIFKKLAEVHRTLGTYYHLETEDSPLVEVHRGLDEVKQLAEASVRDSDQVLAFINAEMLPAFGQIGEDNYEPYLARSGKGIIWACFHPESFREDAVRHMATFHEVAASFPHLPVVYTDTKEYEDHVKEELGCTEFPTLVVQLGNLTAGDTAKRYRKVLLEEEMNGKALTSWVQSVLDGAVDEDDGLDDLDDEDDYEDANGEDGEVASEGGAGSAAKTEL